jgi:hypothetical protein
VGDIHPMFQSMGMDVSHDLMSNMRNISMRAFIPSQVIVHHRSKDNIDRNKYEAKQ